VGMTDGIDAIGYDEPVLIVVGAALAEYRSSVIETDIRDDPTLMMVRR